MRIVQVDQPFPTSVLSISQFQGYIIQLISSITAFQLKSIFTVNVKIRMGLVDVLEIDNFVLLELQ